MNTDQIKTAGKASVAVLVLSLMLLPGTAMASNDHGTGQSVGTWQRIVSSVDALFQGVADWFESLGQDDDGVSTNSAGNGTGKPVQTNGAGNGTGKPVQTRDAGNGTGKG